MLACHHKLKRCYRGLKQHFSLLVILMQISRNVSSLCRVSEVRQISVKSSAGERMPDPWHALRISRNVGSGDLQPLTVEKRCSLPLVPLLPPFLPQSSKMFSGPFVTSLFHAFFVLMFLHAIGSHEPVSISVGLVSERQNKHLLYCHRGF